MIKHASFSRVHAKKAIHSRFGAREHQVGIELYHIIISTTLHCIMKSKNFHGEISANFIRKFAFMKM